MGGIRYSVAILVSTVMLVVGTFAIAESARQHEAEEPTAATDSASEMAEGVFGGLLGGGAGEGFIWFGVAALVLIALSVLVYAGTRGGR